MGEATQTRAKPRRLGALLARWPGWLVAAACVLWLIAFPVAYVPVRYWLALRAANAAPCIPGSMCLELYSIEPHVSHLERWLFLVAEVGLPLLFALTWRRVRKMVPDLARTP
jgi:hypothetical protein